MLRLLAVPCLLLPCFTPVRAEGVRGFLRDFCIECHGAENPRAKLSVHGLVASVTEGGGIRGEVESWEKVLEMVSLRDMPPEKAVQPDAERRAAVVDWLTHELRAIGRGPRSGSEVFPRHGNRVEHEALFSGEHKGPAYSTARLWRISPDIYYRFAATVDMARKLNSPLQDTGTDGFRDYDVLFADEASIRTLLQNSKRVANTMIHGPIQHTRNRSSKKVVRQGGRRGSRHRPLGGFVGSEGLATRQELESVLAYLFRFLLHRESTSQDRESYLDDLFEPLLREAGREIALESLITAILMSPEFLFRMELGLGEELPDGRRMLSPREIAYSLSFAVFDHVDRSLIDAASRGLLATREDVAREFRRVLQGKDRTIRSAARKTFWSVGKGAGVKDVKLMDASHPRLLRFFREFFGYTRVTGIFKDDTRHDGKHDPWSLVRDADWFVLRALKDDRRVLEQLLTSDRFFVQSSSLKPVKDARPYNLDSPDPPIEGNPLVMPGGQRAGMLTHPAWLAAYSGNFENDPVRRGKWIREHLLAGVVPDLPIGVEAQLPESPEKTLRQRFDVVRKDECWRCHKKMNPLGNPFEAYDDFGRFRGQHFVSADGRVMASEFEAFSRQRKIAWRDSHPKRHPPEEFSRLPVDTSGELSGTGDAALDGDVSGPIELVTRLAKSTRVRQSFIRHVFRYWMGRNETIVDSPTLVAMDRAYVDSDGSFRELLVALVTSDSFLYRK